MKTLFTVGSVCFLIITAAFASATSAYAADYYVDASAGNDMASGASSAPWRTVDKVNKADLKPGDRVFFRKGQRWSGWSETLIPKSGIAGSPVFYGAYGAGELPIIPAINASSRAYVTISDLDVNTTSGNAVLLAGAHHITVQKCTIHSTVTAWAPVIAMYSQRSSGTLLRSYQNRILNNTISLNVLPSSAMNDVINLRAYSDHNLIEGNAITISGGHTAIGLEGVTDAEPAGTAHFNIVRNNSITSRGGSTLSTMSNAHFNVIEGNRISGCDLVSTARTEGGMTIDTMNNIVRKNILRDKDCRDARGLMMESNAGSGYANYVQFNHVYNNVITGVTTGGQGIYLGTNGQGGVSTDRNYFKNNAIYENGGRPLVTDQDGALGDWTKNAQIYVVSNGAVTNNYFNNNLFFKSNDSQIMWVNNAFQRVDQLQASSPYFSGNIQADPLLDSELKPLAGSPVIDAGTFLTTVASPSGSGPSIVLADAGYFTDGAELVAGDVIQVGAVQTTIQKIDYATNSIQVSPAISWVRGANVSLPYTGNAPDIGVFESGLIVQPVTFRITASAGPNGTITPAGVSTVNSGASRAFTITPASGFVVDSVLVDGASVGALTSYSFSNVLANHTISATFRSAGTIPPNTVRIDASAGTGGTINPYGAIMVIPGESKAFSIQPNQGYYTASVVVNGQTVLSNLGATSYTLTNVTAPSTIVANFGVSTFNITASAGPNGSISPAGVTTVNYGSSRTYTITPAAGYAVASVLVNGTSIGAPTSYTFSNIAANQTISATFKVATQISIQASASVGGTITPSGISYVSPGASRSYTITPNQGYYTASVVVNGQTVASNLGATSYTFTNVTSSSTIVANFGVSTFSITASAGPNGSISPAGVTTVNYGSSRTYTITPAAGYAVAAVLVNGISVGAPTSYTFSSIAANQTISATFKLASQVSIQASASAGGTISPSGLSYVSPGGSRSFTITPNQGYYTASIVVNGRTVLSNLGVTSYTLSNVTAPTTIVANFAVSTFSISASAGPNGSISPVGVATVPFGSSRTYTITPAAGYAVAAVLVNGASVGARTSYTFSSIAANQTISATFRLAQISIRASTSVGGTISPSGVSYVNSGGSLTYTIRPNVGYYTASVVVDGRTVISNVGATSYTFSNVTAPRTIVVNFGVSTFNITASAGLNGSISPAGVTTVSYGSSRTYTITPAYGYAVGSVLVNGVSVGARTSYTFSNIAANQTISATFIRRW